MWHIRIASTFAGLLMLAACVEPYSYPPYPYSYPPWIQNVSAAEAMGALAGGALGGYLGSQFGAGTGTAAMTAVGVAAGAALGRELGQNLEHPNAAVAQPYAAPCDVYGRCQPPSPVPGGTGGPSAPDPRKDQSL
jgi:glycine zipper 2TM protein